MKLIICVLTVVVFLNFFVFVWGNGEKVEATVVLAGDSIQLPCGFKFVGIEYKKNLAIAVMRQMRQDDVADVWVIKPVADLLVDSRNDLPITGSPSITIRECLP